MRSTPIRTGASGLRVVAPDNRTLPSAIHAHACEREHMPNFERARASPTRRSELREREFWAWLFRIRRRTPTLYGSERTNALVRTALQFEFRGVSCRKENCQKKEKRRVPALPPLFEAYHAAPPPPTCELGSPHDDTRNPFSVNPYPRYGRHPHEGDSTAAGRKFLELSPTDYLPLNFLTASRCVSLRNSMDGWGTVTLRKKWRTPRDLNPQPSGSKPDALSN